MAGRPSTRRPWARRPCWPLLLLLILLTPPAAGDDSAPGRSQQSLDYMIVVTGGELLSGVYPDGHTHFLTRTLQPLGLHCVGSMCVDDKPLDLQEAIQFALGKAPLVIVTGGLGPTDNDITRETLSEFTRIALKEHPDVLQAMSRRFGVPPDQLRDNLRRQTRVPVAGTYLKNSNGTAVGLVFEPAQGVIVALPGPPRELQTMARNELVPYLSRRFGTRLPGCAVTLRFVGLGQSQIDETLKSHVSWPPGVTLCSQFEGGRVDFTFSLPDDTPRDRARLEKLKQQILTHLGDSVYACGDATLEQHVIELLATRGETLVLAEVASGGGLAAGLSAPEGAGQVLAGAYVALSEQALRRLLGVADEPWTAAPTSAQRVKLLASAAAGATQSNWAVAVGQSEEDDAGNRFVEVVLKSPGGLESRRVRVGGSGELARQRLATQLLDQLRRKLR
ncbi:MAG: CinA family protein [Pirellulales bacterium]|nr:CinA family protein [Pirellulales bacterium]